VRLAARPGVRKGSQGPWSCEVRGECPVGVGEGTQAWSERPKSHWVIPSGNRYKRWVAPLQDFAERFERMQYRVIGRQSRHG
jgi:hypothetical protein